MTGGGGERAQSKQERQSARNQTDIEEGGGGEKGEEGRGCK